MRVFRWIPSEPFLEAFWNGLKTGLLRLFGAKIGKGVVIRSSCEVYYPWNLEIGDHCWVGYGTNLYNLVPIRLGNNVCVSQESFLCTGSHDATDPYMGLIVGEIEIRDGAWVCASCFVQPGVIIGEGSVIAPGSVVTADVPPMKICGGIPCKPMQDRKLRDIPLGTGGGVRKGKTLVPPEEIKGKPLAEVLRRTE